MAVSPENTLDLRRRELSILPSDINFKAVACATNG
jgi:hypothetical protein